MDSKDLGKTFKESLFGTGTRTNDLYLVTSMIPSTILRTVDDKCVEAIKEDYLSDATLVHPDNQKFIGFFHKNQKNIMLYDGQHRCTAYIQLINDGKMDKETKVRVDIITVDDECRENAEKYLESKGQNPLVGNKLIKSALTLIREDHLKMKYSEFDEVTILRSSIATVLKVKEDELRECVKTQKALKEFLRREFNYEYPDQILASLLLDYDVFKEAIKLSKRFHDKEIPLQKNRPISNLAGARIWTMLSEKSREHKKTVLEKIKDLLAVDIKNYNVTKVRQELSSIITKKNNAGSRGSKSDKNTSIAVASQENEPAKKPEPSPPMRYSSKADENDVLNMSEDIFISCEPSQPASPLKEIIYNTEPRAKKGKTAAETEALDKLKTEISNAPMNHWFLIFIHKSEPFEHYKYIQQIKEQTENFIILLAGFEHYVKLMNELDIKNKLVIEACYGIEREGVTNFEVMSIVAENGAEWLKPVSKRFFASKQLFIQELSKISTKKLHLISIA